MLRVLWTRCHHRLVDLENVLLGESKGFYSWVVTNLQFGEVNLPKRTHLLHDQGIFQNQLFAIFLQQIVEVWQWIVRVFDPNVGT